MDIKEEIIYPEDTVQILMREEQDTEDCCNIKQENLFFKEEFDERDIKQEENLFVKEEFEDGEILGTEAFTNNEEDLSEVKDNASILTLGTSFNKKDNIWIKFGTEAFINEEAALSEDPSTSTLGTSFNKKEKMTCLGCHCEFVNLAKHFKGTRGTTCKQKYLVNLDNPNEAFVQIPEDSKRNTIVLLKKSRHNRKTDANNYEEAEFIFCKGCCKPFQKILSHLNRENGKSCREFYGAEELQLYASSKARKEQMKENSKKYYQRNKEKLKEKFRQTYQVNREAQTEPQPSIPSSQDRKEQMRENSKKYYEKHKERLKEKFRQSYQVNTNREARREQMKKKAKENYQKNKEARKQKMRDNYIKRKLLTKGNVDDIKEDANDDEIDQVSREDDSDDEEDVFAKEDVFVAAGNQKRDMPCEKADWQTKEINQ